MGQSEGPGGMYVRKKNRVAKLDLLPTFPFLFALSHPLSFLPPSLYCIGAVATYILIYTSVSRYWVGPGTYRPFTSICWIPGGHQGRTSVARRSAAINPTFSFRQWSNFPFLTEPKPQNPTWTPITHKSWKDPTPPFPFPFQPVIHPAVR